MSSRATDSGKPSGPFRKPRADLYTMMLLVALLALVIGTVFLYLEVQRLESRAQAPGPSGEAFTGGLAGAAAISSQLSAISIVGDLETTVG
jgi:hypothetical protein